MTDILKQYQKHAVEDLEEFFSFESPHALYGMMRYFMGFADESFASTRVYGGKHFRASLCLLAADLYDGIVAARGAATAIELFHNFSLIHDDVVDCDELRRGRPTVWKLWGIPHAINTGDGQLLLVYRVLGEAATAHGERGIATQNFLTERFLEVVEGQYLDFTLTDLLLSDTAVTQDAYFTMITKKTSVLVGAALKAGGMMAGAHEKDCEQLYAYGLALGRAVQLNDDVMSVWGDSARTGKDAYGDIKERKKTLPVLRARNTLPEKEKHRFIELYERTESMTKEEVAEVLDLLNQTDAKEYTEKRVADYLNEAREALSALSCSEEGKQKLRELFFECFPQ